VEDQELWKSANRIRIAKNFCLNEFQSPDTLEVIIHPLLLLYLQLLRDKIDKPIIITSGYRTAVQNRIVNGAKNSFHMFGMAADIFCRSMSDTDLGLSASMIGFSGVVLYKNHAHVHVDVRPGEKVFLSSQ